MCVNANIKYLATYKEKIEIFIGKKEHLCTLAGNICFYNFAQRSSTSQIYSIFFFFTLAVFDLDKTQGNTKSLFECRY